MKKPKQPFVWAEGHGPNKPKPPPLKPPLPLTKTEEFAWKIAGIPIGALQIAMFVAFLMLLLTICDDSLVPYPCWDLPGGC